MSTLFYFMLVPPCPTLTLLLRPRSAGCMAKVEATEQNAGPVIFVGMAVDVSWPNCRESRGSAGAPRKKVTLLPMNPGCLGLQTYLDMARRKLAGQWNQTGENKAKRWGKNKFE